jgi:TRAP-type C4-dicarboxylate transport system substrate-binding protein
MSGHTWKKLTLEQQEIVVAAARDASRVARQAEWKQNHEATVQMKAEGVRFYPFPSEERKAMRELTDGIRRRVAQRLGVGDILTAIQTDTEE